MGQQDTSFQGPRRSALLIATIVRHSPHPLPFAGREENASYGNLAALAQKTRFIDMDLNRMWSPQRVAVLRAWGMFEMGEHEVGDSGVLDGWRAGDQHRARTAARGPLQGSENVGCHRARRDRDHGGCEPGLPAR